MALQAPPPCGPRACGGGDLDTSEGQRRGGSPRAEREEKRRRCVLVGARQPIWSSPPEWLYLPHLGIGGGQQLRTSSPCASTSVHASADDAFEVAGTAAIRGRAASPGSRPPQPFVVSSRRVENSAIGALDANLQLGTPTPGPHAPRRGDIRSRAEAKLAARNAGLAISLADHAERVDRRSAQGRPTPALSATDRLAALRRRLEERVRAKVDADPTDDAAGARGEQGGPLVLEEATHSSSAVPTSTEDDKIHLVHVGGGIRSTTAKRPREAHEGGGQGAGALAEVGGGARGSALQHGANLSTIVAPMDAATAAAARQVAWHTTGVMAPAGAEGSN